MVEVETILQVIPALGVIIALLYYSYTIRNTEKIRRKDYIFQSTVKTLDPEFFDAYYSVGEMWDYETVEEYIVKFSREQRSRMDWVISVFNVNAIAYQEGVAPVDVFKFFGTNYVINLFEMAWPYMRDLRVVFCNSDLFKAFEELYFEARKRNPSYVPAWQEGLRPSRAIHP
jgi:hypothetical protein